MPNKFSILITGGTGYIGSHTCLDLLNNGYDILIIDSLVNSSTECLRRISELHKKNFSKKNTFYFFEGDVRNELCLNKVFKFANDIGKPIKGVIHLAGLKSVKESFNKIFEYYQTNFGGTLNLLKVMRSYNCNSLIYSSSATVYHKKNKIPFLEDYETLPENPYGESKLAVENFLRQIIKQEYKWNIIILRYFNPVSAHDSGLIGEDPKYNSNNLFPNIHKVIKNKIKFLKIYGKDWPSLDGTAIRDFIHIMDLAEGHTKSLEYLLGGNENFKIINLGTGLGISVLEVIKSFQDFNNCSITYKFHERREGDIYQLVADISFAKKILNWSPKRNLKDICRDQWKWINNN